LPSVYCPSQDSSISPLRGRRIAFLILTPNLKNLLRAIRIINAPWGLGIGASRITVSTSGLAPQIRELANESTQFRLALSLYGPTDEVRS
jgi:adenine C2-methylase RlmN of 23S rRNA A2503 and tRNA A37